MRLFADENLPWPMVVWLRARGEDVTTALESGPQTRDDFWLHQARAAGRLLLTEDKDFGDLVFRDELLTAGVVLLRLGHLRPAEQLARLQEVWPQIAVAAPDRFVTVTPTRVRVRELPAAAAPPADEEE